jgi:hypothetical protein
VVTLPADPLLDQPERWCVGFTDVDTSGHWLRRLFLLLRMPRHVVCFRDTGAGLLVVQQTVGGLSVTLQRVATEKAFTAEIEAAGGSVTHRWVTPEDRRVVHFRPFTCTCIARSLLALPYRAQTPRALASQLRGLQTARTGD